MSVAPLCAISWSVRPCADSKTRSEEHTSELQSRLHLVCRLLLEKKKKRIRNSCTSNIAKAHVSTHVSPTSLQPPTTNNTNTPRPTRAHYASYRQTALTFTCCISR